MYQALCWVPRHLVGLPNETKCDLKSCPSRLHRGKEIAGSLQSSVFREVKMVHREDLLNAQNIPQEASVADKKGGISSIASFAIEKIEAETTTGFALTRH